MCWVVLFHKVIWKSKIQKSVCRICTVSAELKSHFWSWNSNKIVVITCYTSTYGICRSFVIHEAFVTAAMTYPIRYSVFILESACFTAQWQERVGAAAVILNHLDNVLTWGSTHTDNLSSMDSRKTGCDWTVNTPCSQTHKHTLKLQYNK